MMNTLRLSAFWALAIVGHAIPIAPRQSWGPPSSSALSDKVWLQQCLMLGKAG